MEIKLKIEQELPGSIVEVKDMSSQHIGHNASGAHVKVTVTYAGFKGKTDVEQHQIIYKILQEEMKQEIHAISITTKEK